MVYHSTPDNIYVNLNERKIRVTQKLAESTALFCFIAHFRATIVTLLTYCSYERWGRIGFQYGYSGLIDHSLAYTNLLVYDKMYLYF